MPTDIQERQKDTLKERNIYKEKNTQIDTDKHPDKEKQTHQTNIQCNITYT